MVRECSDGLKKRGVIERGERDGDEVIGLVGMLVSEMDTQSRGWETYLEIAPEPR